MTIKQRYIQVMSDGSLNLTSKLFDISKKTHILEKDIKNFNLYKKNKLLNTPSGSSITYKKKYLM
jgi:hypothetical protein